MGTVRRYSGEDLPAMIAIWNEVVAEGMAFPQEDLLDEETGAAFFASQTYCGVTEDGGGLSGLYILHPNNVGRCGQICNGLGHWGSACFSSTPWSPPIPAPADCMRVLGFSRWG